MLLQQTTHKPQGIKTTEEIPCSNYVSIKGQLEALLHVAFVLVAGASWMEQPPYGFLVALRKQKETYGVSLRRLKLSPQVMTTHLLISSWP